MGSVDRWTRTSANRTLWWAVVPGTQNESVILNMGEGQ